MKTIVYHSADHDGHCSGAIAKKWCVENGHAYELVPWNYGQAIPDLTGKDVIMTDLSIQPYEKFTDVLNKANSFIWIDHHISAIKAMQGVAIEGLRDDGLAACELTWLYFYPTLPIPTGISYLGAYDSWRHDGNRDILGYEWYLRGFETDPSIFDWDKEVFRDTDMETKINTGKMMLQKDEMDWKMTLKGAFEKEFNGLKILCVNTTNRSSMLFGDRLKDYDFAVTFYMTKEGLWKHGLYSVEGKTDVSLIAAKLGGGGHKGASGCILKNFIWENCNG